MNENAAPTGYPLRIGGALDGQLSRWMWLVKWVLVIPHVIVLVFLWIAFVSLTIVAFFAIPLSKAQLPVRWCWMLMPVQRSFAQTRNSNFCERVQQRRVMQRFSCARN